MVFDALGSFGLRLLVRVVLLLGSMMLLASLLVDRTYPLATALVGAVVLAQVLDVLRFVRRTNLELSRFLDSMRYRDFNQRFEVAPDAGFAELGRSFRGLAETFRGDRRDQETELRHLRALLEHVPVPILTVSADESTQLWNNSARRLFADAPVRRLEDLARWGPTLPQTIRGLRASARATARAEFHGVEQTLAIECGEIVLPSGSERLISLLNIQSEIDDTQLDAWHELVRVLTHEIMNSLTPVTSLARTATELLEDARERVAGDTDTDQELDDVSAALDTVARRADGLMGFVASYRKFTGLPSPERSNFSIADLLEEVQRLVEVPDSVTVEVHSRPPTLQLIADRQMVFQVLLNLVQNAVHALENTGGHIEVLADVDTQGRARLRVVDDGPGIEPELAERIFVPFFTTRREGSGVGLAFSRRVMVAHGGAIQFRNREPQGAEFTLVF